LVSITTGFGPFNFMKVTEKKKIQGFENYKILNNGTVLNCHDMPLKPDKSGRYLRVKLYINNIGKKVLIHRLVANQFIPNPLNLPEVNHKDGNKRNNNVENLEWSSSIDNMLHYRQQVSKSGIVGVSWFERDKKWRARIVRNSIKYHLGSFETIEMASKAIKNKLAELGIK
jgi:hypothetical protein